MVQEANEPRIYKLALTLLVAAIALAYWRSGISQALHWDDDRFFAFVTGDGMDLKEPLVKIWTQFIEGDYIPIPLTSFWIETHLFHFHAPLIHIDNVVIHLLNVLLLIRLMQSLKLRWFSVGFVTLCFAVHPLQVEPVFWLSDRKSLLNGFGLLLALIFYRQFSSPTQEKKKSYLFAYYAAFLLACLSKATSLLLPVAVVWFEFFIRRRRSAKPYLYQVPPMLVALAFGLLRIFALSQHVGIGSTVFFSGERLITATLASLTAIGHYVKSFVWPAALSPFYPTYSAFPNATGLALLGVALLIIWFTLAFRLKDRRLLGGLIFFLVFLLPVLPIFPRANFVNDRYMYIPILGISYFAGEIIQTIAQKIGWPLRGQYGLLAALALMLALSSEHQSRIWQDDQSFWESSARRIETSALVLNNLAMNLRDRGQVKEAALTLRKALSLPPEATAPRGALWLNLGDLYGESKWPTLFSLDTALVCYLKALESSDRPKDRQQALLRLRDVYSYLGRVSDAEAITAQLQGQSLNQ